MKFSRFLFALPTIIGILASPAYAAEKKPSKKVAPKAAPTSFDVLTPGVELRLVQSNSAQEGTARVVADAEARSGWAFYDAPPHVPAGETLVWFGYTYLQQPGKLRATFRLKVADNTSPQEVAVVRGWIGGGELANKNDSQRFLAIKGTDFKQPNVYQEFSIELLKGELGFGDWAVMSKGVTPLWYDGLEVEQATEFSSAELLALIAPQVKPANLALSTDAWRVHQVAGLFSEQWRLPQAVALTGAPPDALSQSHLKVHPQQVALSGYPARWEELYRNAVVVLNNVPAKAVTLAGTMILKQYVQDGGTLVLMGDTHSLGAGLWANTPLEPLLPVVLGKARDVERAPKPLMLKPRGAWGKNLDWTAQPYSLYFHRVLLRPNASVIAAAGETPLIVQSAVGKGRIVVILASVLGAQSTLSAGVPFWQWKDWSAFLASIIRPQNGNLTP